MWRGLWSEDIKEFTRLPNSIGWRFNIEVLKYWFLRNYLTRRICSALPLLSRSIQTSINILNTTFCSTVILFLTSPTDTISCVNLLGTYHLPRLDVRERVYMTSFTTYCFTRSFFPCRPTRIQKIHISWSVPSSRVQIQS